MKNDTRAIIDLFFMFFHVKLGNNWGDKNFYAYLSYKAFIRPKSVINGLNIFLGMHPLTCISF